VRSANTEPAIRATNTNSFFIITKYLEYIIYITQPDFAEIADLENCITMPKKEVSPAGCKPPSKTKGHKPAHNNTFAFVHNAK
jgi:hypothetical protein